MTQMLLNLHFLRSFDQIEVVRTQGPTKMKLLAVAVVLVSCCFTSVLLDDSKPYSYSTALTSETYELALKSHRIVFMKFYAPW